MIPPDGIHLPGPDGHDYWYYPASHTVNAWGLDKVTGVMFDVTAGTVQTGIFFTCNLPAATVDIVRGGFNQAFKDAA